MLSLLSRHPDVSFTLSEICQRLDLNVSTAHALLNALADARFLVRQPDTKRYSLGPELVRIGSAAAGRQVEVTETAREYMARLAATLRRQCVASTIVGEDIVILARSGRLGPLGLTMDVGHRMPFLPPFGTVFAAWSDAAAINTWLDHAGILSTTKAFRRCVEALSAVRAHGYSVGMTIDERLEGRLWMRSGQPGKPRRSGERNDVFQLMVMSEYLVTELKPRERYRIGNISAPVFDAAGQVVLALAIPYSNEVLSGAEIEEHAGLLVEAAKCVTESINGKAPCATENAGAATRGRAASR